MSRALRLEYPGAIWHITSRGNERRPVFLDDHDRSGFLGILSDVVQLHAWSLHAWVLMDNHYHLLVETPRVPTISRGIKRLNELHAQRFNSRHERSGHLFQGRFKGILVEKEAHLLELTRYIVLNPVRCGAVKFAGEWKWSNYRATAGLVPAPPWLEVDWTLEQFGGVDRANGHEGYRQFVADGRGAAYNPWERLVGQIYLGGEAFCDFVQGRIDSEPRAREHPRVQRRVVVPTLESIVEIVAQAFCFGSRRELRRKSRGLGRKALAHLALREGDVPLALIAEEIDTSIGAVSKLIRSSERLECDDSNYRQRMQTLRRMLHARALERSEKMRSDEDGVNSNLKV